MSLFRPERGFVGMESLDLILYHLQKGFLLLLKHHAQETFLK
jgi:hypothetical protein